MQVLINAKNGLLKGDRGVETATDIQPQICVTALGKVPLNLENAHTLKHNAYQCIKW